MSFCARVNFLVGGSGWIESKQVLCVGNLYELHTLLLIRVEGPFTVGVLLFGF